MVIFNYEMGQQTFITGSHIPLICFVGDANDNSHGPQARIDRDEKASRRGPGYDRESRRRRPSSVINEKRLASSDRRI